MQLKKGEKRPLSISADTDYNVTHQARNLTNDFKIPILLQEISF